MLETHIVKGVPHFRSWCRQRFAAPAHGAATGGRWVLKDSLANGGDGICLALPLECDLNTWLGDPCPGFGRVLRVRYSVSARDDCGDSSEMTRSGHRKNFLIPKRGTMVCEASANGTLLVPLRLPRALHLPAQLPTHDDGGGDRGPISVSHDVWGVAVSVGAVSLPQRRPSLPMAPRIHVARVCL